MDKHFRWFLFQTAATDITDRESHAIQMYTHGFVEDVMAGPELVLNNARKNVTIMKFLQAVHGSSASLSFGT